MKMPGAAPAGETSVTMVGLPTQFIFSFKTIKIQSTKIQYNSMRLENKFPRLITNEQVKYYHYNNNKSIVIKNRIR